MAISPPVIVSSPAIMRSSVDLPQPEGPTMTTNSPSAMSTVDAVDHRGVAVALLHARREMSAMSIPSTSRFPPGPDEEPLHRHHHEDRRQHRQHRGRHDHRPVGLVVAGGDHPLDAHDDGVHRRIGGDEQRPEVLVPAVDEQDDEERRDVGARQRQQDVLEEAQRAGPVHPRRLRQFVGDGQEELAEQEGGGGRGDQRQVSPA
jgi:hypothetical protein